MQGTMQVKIDESIVSQAQAIGSGANVHRTNDLVHGYYSVCELLGQLEPGEERDKFLVLHDDCKRELCAVIRKAKRARGRRAIKIR